ncbi:hypothetical protein BD408DRAFT_416771 [Parasitella parasitica]|nr:hypothetical protein BD408DRAFT_416771 [Parasitella parasitica]
MLEPCLHSLVPALFSSHIPFFLVVIEVWPGWNKKINLCSMEGIVIDVTDFDIETEKKNPPLFMLKQ